MSARQIVLMLMDDVILYVILVECIRGEKLWVVGGGFESFQRLRLTKRQAVVEKFPLLFLLFLAKL